MSIHLPEQGQLVEVRNRPFIVTEVSKSTQPASLLVQRGHQVQHLVTLTAVEDDALGGELQVIWEVEAGAQIYEQETLPTPTGFDPPRRLAAFLNAVCWGAAVAADGRLLQAPFRSGIDIEDYQIDHAVAAAYGWSDLDLGHGFHDTAQGLRYTISDPARREVLALLLALNHERYAEEVKAGLHEKKGKKSSSSHGKEANGKQIAMFS